MTILVNSVRPLPAVDVRAGTFYRFNPYPHIADMKFAGVVRASHSYGAPTDPTAEPGTSLADWEYTKSELVISREDRANLIVLALTTPDDRRVLFDYYVVVLYDDNAIMVNKEDLFDLEGYGR